MSKEEIIGLCHFYGGELQIPEEYKDKVQGKLWLAEQYAHDYPNLFNGHENREKRMAEIVCAFVSKFDYDPATILDVYFKAAPAYRADYYQLYAMS